MSAGLRAGTSNDGYIQINGTDVLTALSSGNIGIATATPQRTLHVSGSGIGLGANADIRQGSGIEGGSSSARLELYNPSTGTTTLENYGAFPIDIRNNGNSRIYILAGGNVGIGTTSPNRKLHVQGDINLPGNGILTWDSGDCGVGSAGSGTYHLSLLTYNGTNATTEKVRITGGATGGGRVGIGITNPSAKLDVVAAAGETAINSRGWMYISSLTLDPNWNSQLRIDGSATYSPKIVLGSNNGYRWSIRNHDPDGGNGELKFRYEEGSLDALTITRTGNVGIGTTTPSGKLHIMGDYLGGIGETLYRASRTYAGRISATTSGSVWLRVAILQTRVPYRVTITTLGGFYGPGVTSFIVYRDWTNGLFVGGVVKLTTQYTTQVRGQGATQGDGGYYLEILFAVNAGQLTDVCSVAVEPIGYAIEYGYEFNGVTSYGTNLANLAFTTNTVTL